MKKKEEEEEGKGGGGRGEGLLYRQVMQFLEYEAKFLL